MKKTLKAIFAIFMAAMLTISFAACGGSNNANDEDGEKKATYENSPEGVVKRLVNAEARYDYVTMAEYYEEPDEYIEEYADEKINGPESYWNHMLEENGDVIEDKLGEKWAKEYINAMAQYYKERANRIKVEIDNVEEDGDEAWVEFTVSYPEEDYENEDIYDEAGIDAEDFYNGDLDEKEAEAFVKAYKKIIIEAVKKADLEEEERKWKVVKVDGKWKYAENDFNF